MKVEVAVPASPTLIVPTVYMDVKHIHASEYRSCVKVEGDVLDSPSY